MKVGIILFSILSAAGTWWWATRRSRQGPAPSLSQKLRIVAKSVMAGVVVYFSLLLLALLYMAVVSP